MPDPVLDLAAQFRAALLKQDTATLARLVNAYQQLYARLKDKIDLFLLKYGSLDEPTKAAVARLAQYGDLIAGIEAELTKYFAYAEVEISTAARASIDLAIKDTTAFLKLYGLSRPATLPTAAIESMLAFLKPDGALYTRLGELAGMNAARVADALLEGVGLGYNPLKVAKLIENYMGGGLTDALRTARTTQLWSYREATRANYVMNSDVVQGWIWWAELDSDVCMACAAEHGSIHDLKENLDGHFNCRCAMLPYVGDNPVEQSGQDWFEGQSEASQREMMGDAKYEAWRDGKFEFSQLSTTTHNDVFGDMRSETPLKDLLEGKMTMEWNPINLSGGSEADEFGKTLAVNYSSMSREEKNAIGGYKTDYRYTNESLRRSMPEQVLHLGAMDNAISKSILPNDAQAWRGIAIDSFEKMGLNIGDDLVGAQFKDTAFWSTSLQKSVVQERFLRGDSAIFEIQLFKGQPAIYLDYFANLSEYELLLPRGMEWEIIKDFVEPTGLRHLVVKAAQ